MSEETTKQEEIVTEWKIGAACVAYVQETKDGPRIPAIALMRTAGVNAVHHFVMLDGRIPGNMIWNYWLEPAGGCFTVDPDILSAPTAPRLA